MKDRTAPFRVASKGVYADGGAIEHSTRRRKFFGFARSDGRPQLIKCTRWPIFGSVAEARTPATGFLAKEVYPHRRLPAGAGFLYSKRESDGY